MCSVEGRLCVVIVWCLNGLECSLDELVFVVGCGMSMWAASVCVVVSGGRWLCN